MNAIISLDHGSGKHLKESFFSCGKTASERHQDNAQMKRRFRPSTYISKLISEVSSSAAYNLSSLASYSNNCA